MRLECGDARRAQAQQLGQLRQPCFQRRTQLTRHHDGTEGIHAMIGRVQSHRAEIAAAADMDTLDRAGPVGEVLPHAQSPQGLATDMRQGEIALVERRRGVRHGGAGFHQGHAQAGPVQGTGQARAHQAAANNQEIMRRVQGDPSQALR